MEKNALQEGFSRIQCLNACKKMGAAPLTRACLPDKQVRRMIGDADNEMNVVMRELDKVNAATIFTLSIRSYRRKLLSAQCTKEEFV